MRADMYCKNELREDSGVFAAVNISDAADIVRYGLTHVQHRGQESAGIAAGGSGKLKCIKGMGLVADVFDNEDVIMPSGNIALGHVRYSTSGGNNIANVQPVCVNTLRGRLAVAHNGNLSNAASLRRELVESGAIFQGTADTELIACLIARASVNCQNLDKAVETVLPKLEGAFCLAVTDGNIVVAARDCYGFRPYSLGELDKGILLSSESCAIEAVGGTVIRDIKPGELLVIDGGSVHSRIYGCAPRKSLCVFEYIYFARPDSVIDGQSVYLSRYLAGATLASQFTPDADIVVGVPDSGLPAAEGYAAKSGIPYCSGLVKNRYIGRTFIQPTQNMREGAVRLKLAPLAGELSGKRIVLVDDSIVRGTTMRRIVAMLRRVGVKEVHLAITSPPFRHACYYGTDVSEESQLPANKYSVEEMRERLNADSLTFLDMERLEEIVPKCSYGLCKACFDGNYP
ncbi:MAG: amidophosphoribosyltransferase, partial [Clostridia bacterium]|nr:amidophosphoribosyltransferase [Clostridia bacterium]